RPPTQAIEILGGNGMQKMCLFWAFLFAGSLSLHGQQSGGPGQNQAAPSEAQAEPKPNPHAGHQMPAQEKDQKEPIGTKDMDHSQMPGMDHSKMDHSKMDHSQMPGMQHTMDMNEAGMFLMDHASGTSMNPKSWPMPMVMTKLGSWHAMFMANAFIVDTQQSG